MSVEIHRRLLALKAHESMFHPQTAFELLFLLIAGHAVGDFALQTEWVATNKNRWVRLNYPVEERKKMLVIWPHLLTAHSLQHGLIVYIITQNITLAVVETVVHWITDFGKNEKWFDFHGDQGIHIAFKLLYTALISLHLV